MRFARHLTASVAFVAALLAADIRIARPDQPAAEPSSETFELSVPRGSRLVGDQLWASRRGFRKTVRFYERLLKRKGIAHDSVPIYRYRGVVVARFLATGHAHRWQAIQIYLHRGHTRIAIIPAPETPETSPTNRSGLPPQAP